MLIFERASLKLVSTYENRPIAIALMLEPVVRTKPFVEVAVIPSSINLGVMSLLLRWVRGSNSKPGGYQ